ncbi:SDR family NAD(P)-dependent oxidoreductase [Streptomyces collinus]|uniref:SDR family NAD(P)-dependent oxidoreductase n=1 Tax=Streptomyces collinus TaxID=42684 RepID=UPI0036EFD780
MGNSTEVRAARLIVLSAGGRDQLDRYRAELVSWLQAHPETALDRIESTLRTGREELVERLAVVVTGVAELTERLRDGTGVVTGTAGPATGEPVQAADLHEAARLWVTGTPVRWPEQASRRSARLSLPQPQPVTRRYWIEPPAALTADPAERLLTGDEFFLRDHALGQVRILPAVAALEFAVDTAARAGHGRATGVDNVLWARPVLFNGEPVRILLRFTPAADGVAYELRRVDDTPDGELCSTGTLRFGPTAPAPSLDLAAIRARLPRTTSADDCYAVFAALGGGYGPSLRGLRSMRSVPGEALAEVAVPDAADLPFDDFTLHPSLLDAMLQAALWTAADPSAPRPRELPFSIDRVEILGPLPEHGYAHAVATATGHDIALAGADGRIAVRLRGVVTRAVKDPADPVDTHLLAQRWQDAPVRRGAPGAGRKVILEAGEDGRLPDSGGPLVVVRLGDDDPLPGLVRLFRTWAAQPNRQPLRVLHVFRPSGAVTDARLLALDGMARSIANEHPDFRVAVITTDGADLRAVADAEAAADHEFRVRYTAAGRQVARWEPVAPAPAPLTPEGTVLVTGGAGALGRHLVSHLGPSARYVLTGRSAHADLTALRAAGLDVHYLPCDLGAPGAAERLVERVHQRFGPLRGVLHLAGVTRDSFLLRKTDEDIAAVLGPKVDGTLALDRATAADPLDFFLCFSSMSGAGSPGQADYAYANRFLDAFAAWRRGSDRPGRSLSVLWSLWADGGIRMDADDTTQARLARRAGLRPLPTADALRAWDRALGHDGDHVLVAHGELDRIRALLDAPAPEPAPAPDPAPTATTGSATAAAEEFLRGVLAEVLEYPQEEIEADTAFEQYGIDSLLIMDLTRRLEDHFGSLPKTLFFEYQELRGLAGWFAEHHGGRLAELTQAPEPERAPQPEPAPAPAQAPVGAATPDAAPSGDRPAPPSANAPEPVAIIGVAARFAESDTLEEFWANLRAGRDLITEIPADRWDWRDYDKATPADRAAEYSRWGSFLRGIDRFDPLFFGISPREAEIIDPQERLFLQTAWHAMEDAGLTRADLRARRVGVYAGAMYGLYQLHEAADGRIGASSHASIANRVSYTLGVTGPSLGVDTMCSSSLTAIHLAVRDLRSGEADMALAGGVNLHVHPYKYRFLGQGTFTSSDGRCRSFGADGDGYVPGEGVGAVLLKPLSAAVRDGDHIHGVILGSSVNHGGRTNGFTVPNPVAQSDLVERALAEAGSSAAALGYLEAHGTGTALGDPVEVRALARVLGASGLPRGSLPIGSVKSNIGHLESASGMAGLCKVLLQMRHGELVPSLHADPVNPNIDFDSTPLRVQTETAPWPRRDGLPRRAGISSFGAGGANAHLVVEEYVPGPPPAAAPGPWLFPLSARTPEGLRALAERLADAVDNGLADRLADVAYTLQHGREAWADRMVVLASTADELTGRLRAGTGTGVWTGSVRGRAASRAAAPAAADPAGLAAAWTSGATVAWPGTGRRLPLPGYPFEELRCWLTDRMWAPSPAGPATHPLLDEIVPADSVDGLTFRTAFAPAHPLIDGHRVGGLRLLPAAAVLEMARAAAAHAGYPVPVRLRDVRWLRPLVVTEAAASARTRLRRDGAGLAFTLLGDSGDSGDRLAQGVVEAWVDDVPEPLPVERIRAALPHRHDGADLYADLAAAGLVYGPALRAVEWIASGADEALASLRVPAEAARFAGCALPPALIDGALHTFAVLRDRAGGPMVPFALAAAEVVGPLPEHVYAHVRAVGPDRYDLTLTDPEGSVLVRLRDLCLRPAPAPRTSDAGPGVTPGPAGTAGTAGPAVTTGPAVTAGPATAGPAMTERPVDDLMYLPRWSPAAAEPFTASSTAPGSDTWLIRPSCAAPLAAALATRLGGSVTEIEPEHFVAPAGRPAHVIVLSGPAQGRTDDPAALDLAQERGVLALFRAAKALQRSGAPVRLTVVTEDALSTGTEPVRNPYAASLHGLALSLAQEHPRWRVAVVDRSSADPVSPDVLDVPAGGPYALRAGVLHRRSLAPAAPTRTREAIRHGGVYLILGGAGGLGLELTEWLVRGYRAKVVLVGRSELDADRRDRLRRLDPAGDLVSYRRADATDPAALAGVVRAVRAEHGTLHGVVHATIVLRDQTVATMTEDTFRAVLDAKTRTSVALHRALGAADGLDFVLFFSSAVALSGSAGQANYAAGSTFEDAFAQHLDDVLAARSAVINWGYWGTVGIVADDRHRERLARTGIHSITPAEGMAAVHDVLGRTDRQVVVIKATPEVLAAAGVERPAAERSDDELAPSAAALPPVARLLTETDQARLDEVVLGWLWELFRGEGVFRTAGERWSADELRRRLGIADGQSRLFAELLRVLTVAGFLRDDGSALTATDRRAPTDPENELVVLCEEQPALNRIDRLLRPCMHQLFGVLRGTVRATEVMFPGGSTELVEGAYRGSPVVDRANELVVAAVLDRVSRLGRPVTVVEVGAGTGGTTASLLPALAATRVELTYVYTDISPAFLQHGRQRFAERYPMVRFQQLDISGDPLAQGFPPGGADVVVAANVLHATPDLPHTLRAVALLLQPGGHLVLNEATSNVVTATLTFGLLDGWWLHRDTGLRLPGSPLLSGDGWRTALDLAGFTRSRALPADEGLTQHVVVAESGPAGPAAVTAPTAEPAPPPAAEPASEPRAGGGGRLVEAARDYVKDAFVQVLEVPRDRLWLDETYENFGVDSLTVPRIADLLAERMGDLPPTLLFEHPTIREVADHLVERYPDRVRALLPDQPRPAPARVTEPAPAQVTEPAPTQVTEAVARPVETAPAADTRIAVIGVAGRYPLADDVDAFWTNLRTGRDCVREVPAERWDPRTEPEGDGTPVSRWGGFLDRIDEFDPRFFQMSMHEAELTDPQERLFLQTAWHTLEDAGYPRTRLRGSRVGVYVGVMYGHYQLFEDERGLAGGMGYASIANRVSYALDLHGPSLAVDTMCSSSLTAIHLACEALSAQSADYALAGGVNLTPHPRKYRQLAAGGFTGESGRCRSFAAGGDGMVPGEGVGAVLLKPLAAAERDGDRILGVILGSAVNHGGKTGGYAVPSPGAQSEVVTSALRAAGVAPADVSYVEAHGTGTALGDPAEVAGLSRAFGDRPPGSVAIGSVKSSIGHLESAAGIAALTKVLLQMRAGELTPSLHAERLNPAVDWANVPFRVQREAAPWTGPRPLRAGVSAFGAGGSNAHLVVEQYRAEPRPGHVPVPAVFPFSGRDAQALRRVVERMLTRLREPGATGLRGEPGVTGLAEIAAAAGLPVGAVDEPLDELGLDPATIMRLAGRDNALHQGAVHSGSTLRQLAAALPDAADVDLGRLSYTLQIGREAMAHRLAVVAHRTDELIEQLDAFLAGRPAGWTGVVTTEPGVPVAPSADPRDNARRWAHGEVIDWAGTAGGTPEPLSLPGYPFEPVRCWIRSAAPRSATPTHTRPGSSSGPALTTVLRLVSEVSGYPATDLDPAASFHDHGLDSLALLRLAGDVSAAFGLPVGPDQLLATPTAAALADWLTREHPQGAPARPSTPEPDDPVVIVGMAGTLPGSADLDEFWAALERGGDLFTEVPADRWDAREHHGDPASHPERTRVTRAGFIGGIDRFDPLFFGISPREARWMDPRQRLLMRTVWAALEDAGIDPGALAGSDTGLFVGVGSGEYAELVQRSGAATDAYSSTGLAPSMLANRISYQLDLHGPSEPVDTACSSSLVALHRAAEALRLGRCGTVIVGGVSLMLSPVTFASLERAGMLSEDGVGRAFDADASGYVRGEGVGAVVLKRLSRARADGNPILAVLRGTAVNHGGRANSLTAPNPRAQADVIRRAHREAAVDPATVGYLETHGTGTVIGDPAETNGLREAFADLYQDWGHDAPARPHCALGALKNTIGHLEPAAGIAAVLRVLLSMRHGRITGDPHGPRPNPHLGLEGTPFDLATGPREWAPPAPGVPRRAGVSAFGYGGANAHVVLEEYPAEKPVTAPGPVVFVLSARDPERLRAYARSFADRPDRWAHDLASTAYTLQVGRGAYPERLAFVTGSAEHAVATLRRFLAGDTAGIHTGRVERDADRTPYDGRGDDETAAAWTRGAQVDWQRRWAAPPRRRSLPTYPFAQERHWFTDGTTARPVSCFTATWQDEPVPAAGEHPGRVLVLGDLPVPGAVHVRAGTEYRDEGPVVTIRPGEQDDYARLLAETPARIVHQWPLLAPGRDDLGIEAMFRIAKELTAGAARTPIRIQVLVPEDALAEAWGGFDASLRAALPGTTFGVVRVDGAGDTRELLAEVAAHRLSGPAVRLSPSGRTVRVLSEIPARPVLPSPLRDGGVYLITGGLGGLGVLLARTLLSRGARVALTGRSPAAERAGQLAELRAHGTVEYYRAAVEDRDAMTRVVAEVIADLGGLDGLFHLAGTVSRNPLPGKDVDELRAHLRARITGTGVLDEVTRDLPLDLFVLYSSLAGQLGDYGLVDYAVGARYLDGFADFRERERLAGRRHGRTVSVNWPMWRAGGMHVDTEDERRYLAGTGFRYLETAEGEQVLDLVLRLDRPQVAVLPGDPDRMRDLVAGMRLRDDGVPALPAAPPTPATGVDVSPELSQELSTQLRELIGEILGIAPSALDPDAGFGEYGLDSFGLQNLAAALAARYDVTVPTTTLFGANTVTKLAAHLADELPPAPVATQTGPGPASSESAPAPLSARARVSVPHGVSAPAAASGTSSAAPAGHEPIAIIGLAGRLPGADDLEQFWQHLADGRDLITETPADRWDWREVARRFGGTARWGGFLTGVDLFDPLFFRISPAEAQAMDPQHRLFLEHTWGALEDAGCRPDRLAGGRVCVFAGVQFADYESMVLRGEHVNAHAGTGLARTMLANRISYLLDLRGPSESVDTACSSSLVALHRAVRSLRTGESDLAIAGGVSLVLSPQTVVAGNQLGVLAPDGRCKALDERADGYVKGEGVGVVVLKTLSRALADGDRVHAVIRGSAVNHGGRASSLTSPNPLAQADLLVEAYRDADVPIETVSYVELHGTGTALGDPVEIDGLIRAHRTLAAGPPVTCGIGTVKSNIGHLEPAAGIAGVIKVVLAMRHRQLPPTLHLSRLNPLIQLDGTPFEPVRETRPWAPGDADGTTVPLRAGVSSFGFGGVNAHVVLEEPPVPPVPPVPVESGGPEIFLLSARDEAALHRYARAHLAFLGDRQPALSSLAHTSQVGRVPMPVRLALVVTSVAELRDRLAAFLAGDIEATIATGDHDWLTEPEGVSYLRRLARERRLDRIARLWQDGAAVDWAALRTDRPALTSMPTYPFARERHWLASPSAAPPEHEARRLLAKGWEPAPVASGPAPHAPVVLVRAETEALATAAFGAAARVVRLDDTDEETGLRAAASIGRATVVIDLVDLSAVPVSDVRVDWARIVLARELIATNRTDGFAYLHVTRGLVSFRAHSPTLRGAAFAGLVRMLSAEYRGVFARTVDVDLMDPDALRGVAGAELAATDPVTEVCVRDGVRYTPALRPTGCAPAAARWSDDLAGRPVVITGGTGALGRLLAAELIERGADRLVLLGQSPLPARENWAELMAASDTDPALAARLRDLGALERPGVALVIESVPLERAREVLDRIRQEWGPIAGIVHCAGLGVMTDPAFIGKRTADMRRVLEPKTTGLQALLDACADDPLRFVVLYSSIAGQVPALAAGMSDYALANSVLDRVAEYRSAAGAETPVFRSVQWPSWQAAGMPEVDTPVYRELGLRTLRPQDGVALLDAALAGPDPVVLPCLVDTTRFDARALLVVPTPGTSASGTSVPGSSAPGTSASGTSVPGSSAPGTSVPGTPVPGTPVPGTSASLAPAPGTSVPGHCAPGASAPVAAAEPPTARGMRTGDGVQRLTEVFAATLRLDAAQIRPDADFADLGVDSIMIVQLLAALERDLGLVAEPSALLENPTIAQLAAALDDRLPERPVPEKPEPVRAPEPRPARVREPERGIAVVGIAAHFPGAPDHATFWRNLVGGVDSVTEVPPSRWDADRFWHPAPQPGRTVSKWGGFLDGIEDFDPDFFRLDPAGAAHVDPLVRQFLEAGAECLADAGLTPAEVAGRRVGVFAGARAANFGAHHAAATTHSISGMAQNFIAAHLSHYLDVRGPAVVVDSACSSALVAVHLAAQSLRTGESDLVIAGGVEILLDEVPFVGMSGAGALSPSGRCHTFDERADGIVLGEGVGALLLKRAEDAIRDGDRVYAVIEGSAVNNDGRTMGITTPNPRAQREVVESALAAAGVSPAQLGYVEAHGTGTMIGDPMELKALTEVLRGATDEVGFCGVGSVKTNIGHTLSAAGIAGLIKVVLSVHHGQLPPTLHCATLNRRFEFDRSPLFPVRELRDWTGRDGVRRAGVSSFGFGGTNAHMVVRQAPDDHVPLREPLDPPRYRRRRFWFDVPVPASANGNGRHDGPTPPAPFFQIQF